MDQDSINVIASEAKQSSFLCAAGMDCFVASAPRNDADGLVRMAENLLTLQPDQYDLQCLWSVDGCVWLIVANDDINYILRAPKPKKRVIV